MTTKKHHPRTPITDTLRKVLMDSPQSCREIGEAAGVPHPVISRFLVGSRGLTLASADKLADYFGLELVPRVKS